MNLRPALLAATLLAAGRLAAVEPRPTDITSDDMTSQATATETDSVFDGHVHVTGTNITLDCDHLRVLSSRVNETGAAIGQPTGLKYLLATGHVHIEQVGGAREARCGSAEMVPGKDEIILRGDPVVIDHTGGTTVAGDVIELFRGQQKVIVHHTHVTGPPMKDLGFKLPSAAGKGISP